MKLAHEFEVSQEEANKLSIAFSRNFYNYMTGHWWCEVYCFEYFGSLTLKYKRISISQALERCMTDTHTLQ